MYNSQFKITYGNTYDYKRIIRRIKRITIGFPLCYRQAFLLRAVALWAEFAENMLHMIKSIHRDFPTPPFNL